MGRLTICLLRQPFWLNIAHFFNRLRICSSVCTYIRPAFNYSLPIVSTTLGWKHHENVARFILCRVAHLAPAGWHRLVA